MKGRLENSLVNEARSKKLIKGRENFLLEYYYSLSATKQPTTVYRYIKEAINFLDFSKDRNPSFDITTLRKMDIDIYMDNLKYCEKNGIIKSTSDKRMATAWSLLHAFVKFLVSSEYIQKDVMIHSERPKIRNASERVFLEQDEIKQVIDIAHQVYFNAKTEEVLKYEGWEARDLLILRMLMETGMRVTALTEINVSDINFDTFSVEVIDKRGKIHHHPLSRETMLLLNEWIELKNKIENDFGIEDHDILFISKIGKRRLIAESVNDVIKKFTKGLNKNITAHKFRGTYGTTLYRETGDIYFVKECMGHSNVATTQIYVEPKTDNKEKALEIMSKIMNS